MRSHRVTARHLFTGSLVEVRWTGSTLESVTRLTATRAAHQWIAPGLFDLQVNGFASVDFQQDALSPDQLLHAAKALARSGCTRFLPTLITEDWPVMTARLRHLRTLRNLLPPSCASIAGWHLEGPFLSPEPGFRGAHSAQWIRKPSIGHLRELKSLTGPDPLLLTLAPETAGAIPFIAAAARLGVRISLGHTNASAQTLDRAIAAGASSFTHLGNACPQSLDRHDNILWRVLDRPGLSFSLIPDGLHLSPAFFRLVHSLRPPRQIHYVSDAMAAAGSPPGTYSLGHARLHVGRDGVVRLPGQTNFAGSSLTPIKGVNLAFDMLRPLAAHPASPARTRTPAPGLARDLNELTVAEWRLLSAAWRRFSVLPARWMGSATDLKPGNRADFCLFTVGSNPLLAGLRTVVGGQEL